MNDFPDTIAPALEIITQRELPFARAQVFAAFQDPALLARWWGPAGFRNSFETFEFRPGGQWVFTMHGPDGTDYPNRILFDVTDAPQRVVLSHVVAPLFRAEYRLAERGPQRTHLHWRMRFEEAALRDHLSAICVPANEQNLDRLAAVLAGGSAH